MLGRVWVDLEKRAGLIKSPIDDEMYPVPIHSEPRWFNLLFDATGKEEGTIYVGYDLIPMNLSEFVRNLTDNF